MMQPITINFIQLKNLIINVFNNKPHLAQQQTAILETLGRMEAIIGDVNGYMDDAIYFNVIDALLEQLQGELNALKDMKLKQESIKRSLATACNEIGAALQPMKEAIKAHFSVLDEPEHAWKMHSLHCEQYMLVAEATIKEQFEAFLRTLQQQAEQETGSRSRSCFISYAWPLEENKTSEYWLQPFLKQLRAHLRLAGVHALLDIADNQPGNSIYQFMTQAEESDYVMLVCTPKVGRSRNLMGRVGFEPTTDGLRVLQNFFNLLILL